MKVSGQHQEGFHKGDKGKPSKLRHDARSPGRRESAGAFRLCGAAGGFVHPAEFVFCGLSHEGEGQDVTGEDEGALPVPGGIGTGVRGRPQPQSPVRIGLDWLCIAGEVQSV